MEPFKGTITKLPRTAEEATRRYLYHYEKNFNGPAVDLIRLKSTAEGFIHQLRKVAPKFYEEKLPTLLNQAASRLLTCGTHTQEGTKKFNEVHAHLCKILQDLRKSQPAGEVNFQEESNRLKERARLFQRQLVLQNRIEKLEATEFDSDELGEEDVDNTYASVMRELDELKQERKRICLEVAYMEGEKIEEDVKFELRVPRNSVLSRLTDEQIKHLEKQMLDFYKESNKKRTAIYVDKSIIDGMIKKLNIDQSKFQKEELREMSKNALDAYKSYHREIDSQKRNQYHEELLSNKHLLPKEGEILTGPDDVPDHIRQKLDQTDMTFKHRFQDILAEYTKRNDEMGENCDGDEDDVEDDVPSDDTPQILESIKKTIKLYARVKEEPRDDYVDVEQSCSEVLVSEDLAKSLVDGKTFEFADKDYKQELHNNYKESVAMDSCDQGQSSDDMMQGNNVYGTDKDSDDDIECLGTIEPADKVQTLQVD